MVNTELLFRDYLDLNLTSGELSRLLGATWRFERDGENYLLEPDGVEIKPISVGASAVQRAIDGALRGSMTVDELQDWANLILLFDGYEIDANLAEESNVALRDVLHGLASPTIYQPLTRQRLISLRDMVSIIH